MNTNRKSKILLISLDEYFYKSIIEILESNRYVSEHLNSWQDFFCNSKELNSKDVIILVDFERRTMPPEEIYALWIKKKLKKQPMIFIHTGLDYSLLDLQHFGFTNVLIKPFKIEDLINEIKKIEFYS